MKEKNKTYTAEDFTRYYAGTMPDNEMHALEKAALEDPFLEDALEGYAHAHAVESDIAELQARLTEKQKNKKVFFISSVAQSQWWRIAALFIVIAGAGYFFYRVNSVSKEDSLAKNEIKASTEKKDNIAPTMTDSAIVKDNIAFENVQGSQLAQKEKTVPDTKSQIAKEIIAPVQKSESLQAPGPNNKLKDGISSDGRLKEAYKKGVSKDADLQVEKEYVLKGKITDENGQAVPYASITDNSRNKTTVTDTTGNFLFRSKDSSIQATASAVGYASKDVKLKKDTPSTIAMNKTNEGLNEIAITALGKRKQLKEPTSASKALNGKVPGVQITSPGLQPSGGKEKFDRYLEENLKLIYDENNEPLRGEVLLSFTINKKGRPKNIKVVRSSCEPCEKEAINLLGNGPGWIGRENIPGTVMIKF